VLPAGFVIGYGYYREDMGHIPDIARSDFHRFGSMKKHLLGKNLRWTPT
jgi:hypothetical protein